MVEITLYNDRSVRLLAASAVAASHTGDTAETTLATITVPAGAMGPNGLLLIKASFQAGANNANTKTFRIRLGGVSGTIYTTGNMASTLSARLEQEIANRGAEDSQVGNLYLAQGGWGTGSAAFRTSSVDTSAETTVVITAQLADGGDALTLVSYSAQLLRSS